MMSHGAYKASRACLTWASRQVYRRTQGLPSRATQALMGCVHAMRAASLQVDYDVTYGLPPPAHARPTRSRQTFGQTARGRRNQGSKPTGRRALVVRTSYAIIFFSQGGTSSGREIGRPTHTILRFSWTAATAIATWAQVITVDQGSREVSVGMTRWPV